MPDTTQGQYSIVKSDLADDDLFRLNSSLNSIASRIASLEAGFSVTIPLPATTTGGKAGSITVTNGRVTSYSPPS